MHTKAPSCRQHSACFRNTRCGGRGAGTAAALLMAFCLALGATAHAQKPEHHPHQEQSAAGQQHSPAQKSSGISPQQAVTIAKQRQQGKVLSVKRTNGSYKVKMLHQGQVRYVTVAAD